MAFSLLWSFGLVVSILVFAIAIGLNLNYIEISKKALAVFSIGSAICTFVLVYAMNLFKVQLNSSVGPYNYLLLFLIAFILIFIGYLTNKQKDYKENFKIILLSYFCFILTVLICVSSKESLFGLDSLQISLLTTILFALIMVMAFFCCRRFNLFDASYKTLGSMYFILGVYFLMVSLFLPNIIALNMGDMRPINIVSMDSIVITIVLLVVVVVLGLLYYKKNTLLK